MGFSVPDEYDTHVQPIDGELPEKLWHVAPQAARDSIDAEGLSVDRSRTHNIGSGWHDEDLDDDFLYEDYGEGPVQSEWRPHAVFVWADRDRALEYCQDGMDLYEIDTEEVGEILRDPSSALNWDHVEDHDRAYMIDHVPLRAIERVEAHELTRLRAERERPSLAPVKRAPEPCEAAARPGPGQLEL